MTTRLTKPVARVVETPRHGAIVVTLAPEGIVFREKGRRRSYVLDHGAAFQRAVSIAVEAEKREKRARRRAT